MSPPAPVRTAGLILCGGRSTRMGMPKAMLPFGPELMLQRVARLLATAVDQVVVVAAQDQRLPGLPASVRIARDAHPDRGPLGGLWAGMHCLLSETSDEAGAVEAVYATSCDSPFLSDAFVRHMLAALTGYDIAIPAGEKFLHPLAAAYRLSLFPAVETLIAADRLRPVFLLENAAVAKLPLEELRTALQTADPGLQTLTNMNDPASYQAALDTAGFAIEPGIALRLGLK